MSKNEAIKKKIRQEKNPEIAPIEKPIKKTRYISVKQKPYNFCGIEPSAFIIAISRFLVMIKVLVTIITTTKARITTSIRTIVVNSVKTMLIPPEKKKIFLYSYVIKLLKPIDEVKLIKNTVNAITKTIIAVQE